MTSPPPGGNRRTSDRMREAFDAVRANCEGKSRDEIERLLRDELAARGIEIPDSLIRPAADVLGSPRWLRGQIRMLRFGLRMLAVIDSESRAISDIFTGADPGVGAIKDPADPTSAWVDVVLDDDGKSALRMRRERLRLVAGARDQVAVRLERNETAVSGSLVDAYVDGDRVGTLTHGDGLRYLPAISAGRQRGERGLLTLGICTVEQDSRPRLRIAPTGTALLDGACQPA